ncbi:hypothetical protein QR680_010170 [Steinernema hermaphroditum]|uniref:Secreted peptide n=1 Tax=Steinernema hermaphroditum TaxID=289476 RepID=A0AA39MB84_9BILA|nr:hypothetical protein QR680_010170 [Steinernema hermaphroditum]
MSPITCLLLLVLTISYIFPVFSIPVSYRGFRNLHMIRHHTHHKKHITTTTTPLPTTTTSTTTRRPRQHGLNLQGTFILLRQPILGMAPLWPEHHKSTPRRQ